MAIVLRNMAKVTLPESCKRSILSMYLHSSRSGDSIKNYKYSQGVAYLPINPDKLEVVAKLLEESIEDCRSLGAPLHKAFELRPGFAFREHQMIPAPKLLAQVRRKKTAVLQAGCGLGKTVVMTWVAGHLGVKILVIVDMGSLLSQWEEAFQMVWGRVAQILTRDDTSFADVCITTFQLLHANPDLLRRISKEFGCLLLDEFHTTQSDTRREVLFRLDNQYRIGCTATPWKKGYADDVLSDLVADVSVQMCDSEALKPDVRFVDTGVSFCSSNPDDWGKVQSKLAQSVQRNILIVQLAVDALISGRHLLLIGITIEQCRLIGEKLAQHPACRPVVYTGSTSMRRDRQLKEDLASGKVNCIITVKKADKGLDLPLLDCLILARPHNNVAFLEQISGRIVRAVPGKPIPLIYDLRDTGALAERFTQNRQRWYERLGYAIVVS